MPQFPHSKYNSSPAAGVFVKGQGSHSPMVEADMSEFASTPVVMVHPFKVTDLGVVTNDVGTFLNFTVYEGHIFGISHDEAYSPWSAKNQPTRVEIGTSITETPPGIAKPGILDNGNTTTVYSGQLSGTEENVLYVKLKRNPDFVGVYWIASLELSTTAAAQTEYNADRPDFQMSLSPPTPEVVAVVDHVATQEVIFPGSGSDTYTFTIEETEELHLREFSLEGTAQIPVATITSVSDKWVITQILRSDIFFPHGLEYKVKTPAFRISDFTIEGGCAG